MLYFAYGSNMDRRQLVDRCASARFRFRGRAVGRRLKYTRFSPRRRCGVLDLVPCRSGEVWGGVYSLDEADWACLDAFEFCAQGGYRRTEIDVATEDAAGRRITMVTYEVRDKLAVEPAPSDDYLATVVAGARQCGLPAAYIESLVANARAIQRDRLAADGVVRP